MITNLIMASLISAAGLSTNLVYNVKMENNRLTDKKTYMWSDTRQDYILQQTETFHPTEALK
ncbi:hypothetical protein [uncultured Mediterranea sp.]|uniref:hypothetical protein n=1 Tax=uncultured Mediterranea sp. TaxID=1926662 RepID=UPI002803C17F|nr:hypothetical protein [uncultured Mediterranea sp.]